MRRIQPDPVGLPCVNECNRLFRAGANSSAVRSRKNDRSNNAKSPSFATSVSIRINAIFEISFDFPMRTNLNASDGFRQSRGGPKKQGTEVCSRDQTPI